jgi:hypothetical protein
MAQRNRSGRRNKPPVRLRRLAIDGDSSPSFATCHRRDCGTPRGRQSGYAGERGRRLHAMSTYVHGSVAGREPVVSTRDVADTLGLPVGVAAMPTRSRSQTVLHLRVAPACGRPLLLDRTARRG